MGVSHSGWEPTNRPARLKMASDWLSAMNSQPADQTVINKERWRVTETMETDLTDVVQKIQGLEQRPASQHTADSKKELADAYDALSKQMRDIKRQCFMTPPLTDRDYVVLGLHIPDREPTGIEPPKATPDVETASAGRLQVRFIVRPAGGSEVDRRADYGIKMKGCIIPRGEVLGQISPCGVPYATEAPKHVLDFRWEHFTRKSKFVITFDNDDLAGLFYFTACYENSKGESGPWGPINFAVIA